MERYGRPVPRPLGVLPNCKKCPKRGPENDRRYRLSEKNIRAYEAYRKYKDSWPNGWAEDEIWARNYRIIREAERFHAENREHQADDRFTIALESIKQALK